MIDKELINSVVENFGSYYMEMKKREVLAEKKKRLQVNQKYENCESESASLCCLMIVVTGAAAT